MTPESKDWDLVIQPGGGFFDLELAEIWRYRDLLVLLVKRDFAAQYKQTILGPLWHVIQPVFTTAIFVLIFDKIANIPTDGVHPVLFYMSGITIWNYFSSCLNATANTFVANAAIFGKVYFPRLVIPLSVTASNMVRFGIQFLILLAVMLFYSFRGHAFQLHWTWAIIPLLVALMAALGLGLGIIISSLTTKYRDLAVLTGFGVQLLIYATPIAYPLSFIASKPIGWIAHVNPLTGIVEAFKFALFNNVAFNQSALTYSIIFTFVILLVGLLLFHRVERTFMDTV